MERGPLPPRALIVTVLGLYVREFGGWISVSALIRLMAAAGVDEQAVRSSLSRLKRRGIVEAERRGGVGRLRPVGVRAPAARGRRPPHLRRARGARGGDWVVVVFSVPESERQKRHALRARLSWLGFGTVSSGVWIAPGHLADDAREVLARRRPRRRTSTCSAREYLAFGDPPPRSRSGGTSTRSSSSTPTSSRPTSRPGGAGRRRTGSPPGAEAFADYVRALTSWRRLPYLDPGLPTDLLPASWSGTPRRPRPFFDPAPHARRAGARLRHRAGRSRSSGMTATPTISISASGCHSAVVPMPAMAG